MSGHSKWSTIKHKKAANDSVKGSVFTKMAKAISIAVKKSGGVGDPNKNSSLRLAIDKARAVNMPRDNIDRAIAKGMGKGAGEELVELTIEAFAPEGVGVIAEVVTDSRNRVVAELRSIIEKHGGSMGEPGSVGYMFDKVDSGYRPKYRVTVTDQKRVEEFLDILREHEDVQEIYANLG
ncbi:MAG: YebC/PmpR family DNA-binding transcriptional regulator [bacterium]